jgi:hypothetical protein
LLTLMQVRTIKVVTYLLVTNSERNNAADD